MMPEPAPKRVAPATRRPRDRQLAKNGVEQENASSFRGKLTRGPMMAAANANSPTGTTTSSTGLVGVLEALGVCVTVYVAIFLSLSYFGVSVGLAYVQWAALFAIAGATAFTVAVLEG